MMIVTSENVPGQKIDGYCGIVWATTVRSRHLGHDVLAMLKSLKGGDIRSYEQMTDTARADVLKKLEHNAKEMGANAVVGMRFGTTAVMPGTIEVYAYGTAVKVKKG
ncbi:YbjQ family protein [Candidatus Micrarchaeota archaeon]|nr:YbjQ family protein [Candidatus Micrarchaeota archaeon]